MAQYSDALYQEAIATTVGDIYYSTASPRSKIASMRILCEYYVRRLIKHSPNADLLLGDKRTKPALERVGVTEQFFWDAFDSLHYDGNDASHSKKYILPTEEEFNIVSKAVVTIQAYLFYDFFKKYEFGSNLEIVHVFSLLPPFFRLSVLHELLHRNYENMSVIDKFGLAAMKALGKDGAMQLIENEKEELELHSLPISSDDAKAVLASGNMLAYAQWLKKMSADNVYVYIKNEIDALGDTFDSIEPMYKNFEEAKRYYLNENKVNGNTPEVKEFNALMEYIYTGRKEK